MAFLKMTKGKAIKLLSDTGAEIGMKYTLGVGIKAEEEFGNIAKIYENMGHIQGCVNILKILANEAILKFNKDYNHSENPLSENEIIGMLGLNESVENAAAVVIATKEIMSGQDNGDCKKKQTAQAQQ